MVDYETIWEEAPDPQTSQLDHLSFRPADIIWGRDESSQVSLAQIASPQNHEQLNNYFKLLYSGVVLVQFSCSVVSDSLWPHEPQHTRPPCPSPTPGVHLHSCPSSRWCYPTISSSVVPFSSHPQSFQASGSFQMSQLFALCSKTNWYEMLLVSQRKTLKVAVNLDTWAESFPIWSSSDKASWKAEED